MEEDAEVLCSPYVEMIVFEEFSMMSLGMLEQMSKHLGLLKGDHRVSFGGIAMVFIGDVFQLEPVSGESVINTLENLKKVGSVEPYNSGSHLWHC